MRVHGLAAIKSALGTLSREPVPIDGVHYDYPFHREVPAQPRQTLRSLICVAVSFCRDDYIRHVETDKFIYLYGTLVTNLRKSQ